jgi:hypothetical protein
MAFHFVPRKVRRFTAAESFLLFMEGIRSLQMYDEEATKPSPNSTALKESLCNAQKFFQDCVTLYPKDLLPRYYLGVVFTVHAQIEHALYFKTLLSSGFTATQLASLPPKAEDYLQKAEKEFGETANRAGGDLASFSLYNRAQTLARLDEVSEDSLKGRNNWEEAEAVLQDIAVQTLGHVRWWISLYLWLQRAFRRFNEFLVSHIVWLHNSIEGDMGIASTKATAAAEKKAIAMQIKLAYSFIEWRKKARYCLVPIDRFPKIGPSNESKEFSDSNSLPALLIEASKAEIPAKAKSEMIADYLNKWAFIIWERAMQEDVPENRAKGLEEAGVVLDQFDKDVKKKSWTPRQMNQVRLYMANSITPNATPSPDNLRQKANMLLNEILGQEPPEKDEQAKDEQAKARVDNPNTIADMVTKLAAVPDPVAIGRILWRSNPNLSREIIGKIIGLLAEKGISAYLLDQIFTNYDTQNAP